MATVLLTWECGGALGHLLRLRPVGERLLARGHKVVFALRDLMRVPELFTDSRFFFLQAPPLNLTSPARPIAGFSDVLGGVGFVDEQHLTSAFVAWTKIIDEAKPDLVVADYSPLALLALRGRSIPKVNMGLATYCPPDSFPLAYWSGAGQGVSREQLIHEETALLINTNRVLTGHSRPPFERLSQLFNHVDDVILATYPELDPFAPRPQARYWRHWQPGGGLDPKWPEARGPKIYAYLKPFSGLEVLLHELRRLAAPTIIFAAGINPILVDRFTGPTMRFEIHPLEVEKVAAQCDFAITHAGHGMICSILLAGKPLLLVPLYGEQLNNAQAVNRFAAGRWVLPKAHHEFGPALLNMVTTDSYRQGAQRFASRYSGFKPGEQVPALADHLESLIRT